MCTHPIQLTRVDKINGYTKVDVVPCGKCAECRGFKRAEFAALSVHQSLVSGTLYFFTLTYSDARLPVAIANLGPDQFPEVVVGFEYGDNREIPVSWFSDGKDFYNEPVIHDGLSWTPSLRREDVKNWLKEFRTTWKRKFGVYPVFKYSFFGEYGENRGRPHYHGLFFGLTAQMADMLSDLWRKKFGFVYCVPPDYRQLSLNEICAVSNYVSKYISKGISSRFEHILPYVERPRRINSRDFGSFSDEEVKRFRAYYDGADLHHLSRDAFLEQITQRRQAIQLASGSYPIPLSLKNKLFYDGYIERNKYRISESDPTTKEVYTVRSLRKSKISAMASKFTRSKHFESIDRQLPEDFRQDFFKGNREFLRTLTEIEKNAVQGRQELAQKNLLTNLKNQKDGQ